MFCPFCGQGLGTVRVFCGSCGRNVQFLAEAEDNSLHRPTEEDLIRKYFHDGYSYDEILDVLVTKHNLQMSLRSLKTILNSLSLSRKKNFSPRAAVCAAIQEELKGPGQYYGYRLMWQTLRQKYSLTVRRDDVMTLMKELDPSGVELRARRRFVRRVYSSNGPNHVWHIDGYDKLKPYGLAISGCIDGYSRKVLWLLCGASNSDPGVVAKNYRNCVSECGIIPMQLRTDCGTENGTMAAIHCALRSSHTDSSAGAASHMYGSSMANQRIESWWSYFRKQRSQFWMDLMNDLKERHLFSGHHEHKCLLRFVFMSVLQRDLDECREKWNTHTIRPVRQSRCPSGKPDVMYHLPHRFGGRESGFPVSQEALHQFDHLLPAQHSSCGDDSLQIRFADLERRGGLAPPTNWTTAVENYISLKNMSGF